MRRNLKATALLCAALGVLSGCSQFGGRSDQQITTDIQSKILGDAMVQNKNLTISSDKGTVTLSGAVSSDSERAAAANDAAQVNGVKTVINNLEVANAAAKPEPATAAAAAEAPAPSEGPRSKRVGRAHRASTANDAVQNYSQAPAAAATATPAATSTMAASTPPPPAAPVSVTVPAGTPISVLLTEPLSSETNHQGDTFHASLQAPLVDQDGMTAIPAGTEVDGTVVAVHPSTHFSGQSLLTLQLIAINSNGQSYNITTNQWSKQGSARGKRTAETIGGGAALGAIIGAIAGGGKGAAIGAGVGAGAGTGVQGVTHGEAIKLPSETRLDFSLSGPITVTPAPKNARQPITP